MNFMKNAKNIMYLTFYCIIVLCITVSIYASEYHEPYSEAITSKMYLINYDQIVTIQDKNNKGKVIEYSPKNDFYINQFGYEYCIKNVCLFFSTSIYNAGGFNFFKTRMFSLYYSFYKFACDVYYYDYDLYNLYEIGSDSDEEKFDDYSEPDVSSQHYGANLYWILSDDFSYNATFKQTERQTESAGSFIVHISPYISKYKSNEILIPENQRIYYDNDSVLKHVDMQSLLLSIGYCYNLTYDGFYIAPFGYIGKEYKNVEYNTTIGDKEKTQWENYYKWGAMIGYNESDSILVLEYVNEYHFADSEYAEMKFINKAINLVIGYRI